MTIAKKIAEMFGNDGQQWTTKLCGLVEADVDEVCSQYCTDPGRRGESTRYEFDDGSAIVVTPGGWDFGHPAPCTCHCWPEAYRGGHADECEERS